MKILVVVVIVLIKLFLTIDDNSRLFEIVYHYTHLLIVYKIFYLIKLITNKY